MKVVDTPLPGVMVLEPKVFGDDRGFFYETWNEKAFEQLGINARFVQDNQSRSSRGVLRGLHYQIRHTQGKLLRVLCGSIVDVVVDMRRSSSHYGKAAMVELSSDNKRLVWVPEGFAHGFLVMSEMADVAYKVTEFWTPEFERTLLWNDPALLIPWPTSAVKVSDKDAEGLPFARAEAFM